MGNSLIMELRPLGAAQTLLATVDTGTTPVAAAANRATNQIYTANYGSNNVTVIDGATNQTTTVAARDSTPTM